jgi:hypothetical protein
VFYGIEACPIRRLMKLSIDGLVNAISERDNLQLAASIVGIAIDDASSVGLLNQVSEFVVDLRRGLKRISRRGARVSNRAFGDG